MLPAIGLIVAIYAVARLLQVPIEHSQNKNKVQLLLLITFVAGGAIILFALDLWAAGMSSSRLE